MSNWGALGEGGSPLTEGALGSDGGSDVGSVGGSPSFFEEATEFSGRLADPAGSAEALSGDCAGVFFPGSPVFAGAAGSLGRDAGFAASVVDLASAGTDVGSAGAGAGVGRPGGFGKSKGAGVNAIGGSKSAKVDKSPKGRYIPVHNDDHVGSRVNMFMGGTINGSHLHISELARLFWGKRFRFSVFGEYSEVFSIQRVGYSLYCCIL